MKISQQIKQAESTPQQKLSMLSTKSRGAQDLYKTLMATKYMDWNISDFHKSEFPKLRDIGDRITRRKKALELDLYKFLQQMKKDMAAAKK